jgi:AcrR family transcriptional regulator
MQTAAEDRIMTAAMEIFCRRGYDGARMQEIADSAGISKASLHYYYRSKDNLFRKTVQELFSLVIRKVRSRILDESSIEEVITQLVNGYMEMFLVYRNQVFYLLTELMKHEELLGDILSGIDTSAISVGIINRFQKEREAGRIIDIEPADLLINIIGMCVYPIIAEPMVKRLLKLSDAEFSEMLARRKPMISEFVLRAILKEPQ